MIDADKATSRTLGPAKTFLSAEWRDLVMLNYAVDPGLLSSYVPRGTSLDSFNGKTYISLVGFRFCHTRLFGRIPVPFHCNFDEVNLRFYVRRCEDEELKRGVVFIAEVVPRYAIALTARVLYGENYRSAQMRHHFETGDLCRRITYRWRTVSAWCQLSAKTVAGAAMPEKDSLEQFITEHYWGYSAQRNGECIEYHVSHVPWQVSKAVGRFEGNASRLYGNELGAVLQRDPDSAFVADGSAVSVFQGKRIS